MGAMELFGSLLFAIGCLNSAKADSDYYNLIHNANINLTDLSIMTSVNECTSAIECAAYCLATETCSAAVLHSNKLCQLLSSNILPLPETALTTGLTYIYLRDAVVEIIPEVDIIVIPELPIQDCQTLHQQGERTAGIYEIRLPDYPPFNAWCEFDDSGAVVIQRRQDGSEDFFRYWQEYKEGFGDLNGEYWLGNDKIHELSKTNHILYVELEAVDGSTRLAIYNEFNISSESDNYRLTALDYDGDAGDSLNYHCHREFSTRDRDNDGSSTKSAALDQESGWWFRHFLAVNLNGRYFANGVSPEGLEGIMWASLWQPSPDHSLVKTVMKITHF